MQGEDGNGGGHRYADAIAVNLWPSRKFEVHGFEVKATRSDWLRELKDGAKADWFHARVDRWLLVAAPGVVAKGELPQGWGLLELVGDRLIQRVPGEARVNPVLDRALLARLLRRAVERPKAGDDEVALARTRGYEAGREEGKRVGQNRADGAREELERWRSFAADFQRETGEKLESWWPKDHLRAYRYLRHHDPEAELVRQAEGMERAAQQIRRTLKGEAAAGPAFSDFLGPSTG